MFFSAGSLPENAYQEKNKGAIEKNLMPALQNILIQLNSGVPAFNILVNISSGKYGDLSKEFGKAVRKSMQAKARLMHWKKWLQITQACFSEGQYGS